MADRLEATEDFYRVEAELYRLGRAPFLCYVAKVLLHKLDNAGGFGPYEFFCQPSDGNLQPITMVAREP